MAEFKDLEVMMIIKKKHPSLEMQELATWKERSYGQRKGMSNSGGLGGSSVHGVCMVTKVWLCEHLICENGLELSHGRPLHSRTHQEMQRAMAKV